jgi:hypothetical protein
MTWTWAGHCGAKHASSSVVRQQSWCACARRCAWLGQQNCSCTPALLRPHADYELKLSELQFELQQEARACQAQKEANARVLKGTRALAVRPFAWFAAVLVWSCAWCAAPMIAECAQLRASKAQLEAATLQEYGQLQVRSA